MPPAARLAGEQHQAHSLSSECSSPTPSQAASASSPEPSAPPSKPSQPHPKRLSVQIAPILKPGAAASPPPPKPPPSAATPNAASSPMANGPISAVYQVAPRPRPGRKAATDEPATRRKQQNREAQRNFRQRKAEHKEQLEYINRALQETNDALHQKLVHSESVITGLHHTINGHIHALQQAELKAQRYELEVKKCKEELNLWQGRALGAEKKLAGLAVPSPAASAPSPGARLLENPTNARSPSDPAPLQSTAITSSQSQVRFDGCGGCSKDGRCKCVEDFITEPTQSRAEQIREESMLQRNISIGSLLSPADVDTPDNPSAGTQRQDAAYDSLEIDFTTSKSANTTHGTASTPGLAASQQQNHVSDCGFCTDEQNCACRALALDVMPHTVPLVRKAKPQPQTTPSADPNKQKGTSKPGSCLECQRNPEMKRFCEQLALERDAQKRAERAYGHSNGERDAKRQRLDTEKRVGCADAYRLSQRLSHGTDISEAVKELSHTKTGRHRNSRSSSNAIAQNRDAMSAYEVDMGAVLAMLHKASTDSGSSSEAAASG